MTSESKILTVSYGTFSCTLEGFDNPFDTMKVIAEYFRDLAAHDRYFGAEPPQPDAAMLHRVAEREVARLVEDRLAETAAPARVENGSAIEPAPGSAEATQDAGSDLALAETDAAAAPVAAELAGKTDIEQPEEPRLQDDVPKGFSAKLARIRASANPSVVADPLPEDQLQAFMPGTSTPEGESDVLGRLGALIQSPDQPDTAIEAVEPDDNLTIEAVAAEAVALALDPEPEAATDSVDEPAELAEGGVDIAALEPEAQVEVVTEEAVEPVDEAEVDPPSALVADAFAPPSDRLEPKTPASPEPIATEPVYYRFADDPDDVDAVAQASDLPAATPTPEAEDFQPETSVFADGQSEDAFDEPLPEAFHEASAAASDALDGDAAPRAAQSDDTLQDGATAKGSGRYERVSSRVVRIKPEDEAVGTESAVEAEAVPDASDSPNDPDATRVVRSRGADAEMSRLLRQAENVMADEENRRRLDSIALMKAAVVVAETERANSDDVRKADEDRQDLYRDDLAQVVEPMPAPEAETPQPKRRKTRSVRVPDQRPGTIRPGAFGPPPLVLVTEQRIDRPPPPLTPPPAVAPAAIEPAPAAMPTPREGQPMVALRTGRLTGVIGVGAAAPLTIAPQQRVVLEQPFMVGQAESDEDEDLDEDLTPELEEGLARFAEQLGVSSTVDMLEAAAAYTTCIEKRSQFTRPQLMRRLMASAEQGSISREDGLRSFGTLLRTGRIEKIGRGNYALSQNSPFLNDARRLS